MAEYRRQPAPWLWLAATLCFGLAWLAFRWAAGAARKTDTDVRVVEAQSLS